MIISSTTKKMLWNLKMVKSGKSHSGIKSIGKGNYITKPEGIFFKYYLIKKKLLFWRKSFRLKMRVLIDIH